MYWTSQLIKEPVKLAGAPGPRYHGLLIPLPAQVIEHALLATFSWVLFLGVCVCMCVLQHEKEDPVKQGVCHTVALPFTLKSMLRQKKNYGNSNISPSKHIIFKKCLSKSFKIL
jgi:hypothetical protein